MATDDSRNSAWRVYVYDNHSRVSGWRTAVWEHGDTTIVVTGLYLDRRQFQTRVPAHLLPYLSISLEDLPKNSVVELSKLRFLDPCDGVLIESVPIGADAGRYVYEEDSGHYKRTSFSFSESLVLSNEPRVSLKVTFDFDGHDPGAQYCTLRISGAVALPGEVQVPDLYLERGQWTYQ